LFLLGLGLGLWVLDTLYGLNGLPKGDQAVETALITGLKAGVNERDMKCRRSGPEFRLSPGVRREHARGYERSQARAWAA